MRRILLAAPITLDLLEYERQVFIDEILKRTRLLFGEVDPSLSRYGILDKEDPRTALPSLASRPLVVSTNVSNPLTVDVSPGTVVFSNGEVLVLGEGASRVPVPTGLGTRSVVYLQFDEIALAPRVTRFDTLSETYVDFLELDFDYVKVVTKSAYDAMSYADREMTIPLALVTVQEVVSSGGPGYELVVDMTTDYLPSNRPWFSPVDIEHRSFQGTGTVTSSNPHGLSLNDLAASSGATIFQLHLDHGMIVSKDTSIAKVPGTLCEETILAGAINVDTSGTFTGIMGARYFETTKFPTQVIRATDASTKTRDYAPIQAPRGNLVFFLPSDQYVADGGDVVIYYMATDALEPPTDYPRTSLEFKQPGERDTIVSGGVVVPSIVDTSFTFEDVGPVPQKFNIYLDSDGYLQRYPQTCKCLVKVSDIGAALQTFDQDMLGIGKLKIALVNAVPGPSLYLKVDITGENSSGTVTESVIFDSTWANNPVGTCSESSSQFIKTANAFTSLSHFQVDTPASHDYGPDASLVIYGDVSPSFTEELADVLPVAEVVWDGLQACSLEDIRPLNTTMHLPRVTKHAAGGHALAELTSGVSLPGYLFNWWVEDFDSPKFISMGFTDDPTASAILSPSSTSLRKIYDGLDLYDTYVGRPVAVRPHTSSSIGLRLIPIESDRNFELFVRVLYAGDPDWSEWSSISGLTSPTYTLPLSGSPLCKWQVVVKGQCKSLVTVYITDSAGTSPVFAWDIGAWDSGAYT